MGPREWDRVPRGAGSQHPCAYQPFDVDPAAERVAIGKAHPRSLLPGLGRICPVVIDLSVLGGCFGCLEFSLA